MIIECAYCNSQVDGRVLAKHEVPRGEDWGPFEYVFLICPVCNSAHVGLSEEIQVGDNEYVWSTLTRVWPNPARQPDYRVPTVVSLSLDEAEKCYRAGAYSACAVMCGRAIEGICVEILGQKNIAKGLQGLMEKNVIDARLYHWAESLREERNISAHASGKSTSKDDARDLMDFARAIFEYIFVLSARYVEYKQRKTRKKK